MAMSKEEKDPSIWGPSFDVRVLSDEHRTEVVKLLNKQGYRLSYASSEEDTPEWITAYGTTKTFSEYRTGIKDPKQYGNLFPILDIEGVIATFEDYGKT